MCNLEKDVFVLLHSLSSVKSFHFFFFLRCETFLRESRCRQNGGKLVWKQKSFQTADGIPPSDLQQHSGKLKPPFSLTRWSLQQGLCHSAVLATEKKKKKTGLKTKTGRWGGSQTDILGLTSAPRGTIRSTSAIQSTAWPTNRLFSHSHYGIIGVVVAGHQQYVYRSGLQQFNRAHRNWKPALEHGTCTSC